MAFHPSPHYFSPPRPPYGVPPQGNQTVNPDNEVVITVVYEILLPIVSTIGVIGNIAVFAILRNRKKFSGFMYSYMKGLAFTDTIYLLFCIQASVLISNELFLSSEYKPCKTKGLAIYVWNILSPFWNMWAVSSDLVIVCMTIDRFRVMRQIDKLHTSHHMAPSERQNGLKVSFQVVAAVIVSLAFHVPFFFQFVIEECERGKSMSRESIRDDCWSPKQSDFAKSVGWNVFNVCYEIFMKLVPATIIIVLNFLMLCKLREVWAQKKQLQASLSCNRNNTRVKGQKSNSVQISTISALLIRAPSVLGYDLSSDVNGDSAAFRKWRSRFARPPKRKLHQRLLPTKVFGKEVRMTVFLVSVVFCHVILTLPGNVTYFLWTVFPEEWDKVPGQLTYDSIGDLLLCVNYSMNFYLYCIANSEVRMVVKDVFKQCWRKVRTRKKQSVVNPICSTIELRESTAV